MSAATDSIDIGHQLKPDFGPLNSFLPDESLPQAVAIQAPESKADIESEVPASEENEESKREKKEQLRKLVVLAPLDYLASLPGKGFRGELMSTFNQWFKIPDEKLEIIKNIVGLLHTASLLIDDIQDSSKLRRGFPVAHSIFGVAQTINSANYAYFQAQHDLLKLGKPESFQAYTEELLSLHHGQGMDLHWRDSLVCPTEGQYLDMVSNKTGGLFRLAIRLIQLESESDLDCVPLVDLLGVIFQIRDDYQNLQSTLYAENKGFGEDITEGKFSYPIIHSISSTPNNPQLLNILRQKTEDDNVKKYAISIIESTGSLAYCREKITKLVAEARDLLQAMPIEEENMKGVQQILGFLDLSKSS